MTLPDRIKQDFPSKRRKANLLAAAVLIAPGLLGVDYISNKIFENIFDTQRTIRRIEEGPVYRVRYFSNLDDCFDNESQRIYWDSYLTRVKKENRVSDIRKLDERQFIYVPDSDGNGEVSCER